MEMAQRISPLYPEKYISSFDYHPLITFVKATFKSNLYRVSKTGKVNIATVTKFSDEIINEIMEDKTEGDIKLDFFFIKPLCFRI